MCRVERRGIRGQKKGEVLNEEEGVKGRVRGRRGWKAEGMTLRGREKVEEEGEKWRKYIESGRNITRKN